MTRTDWIREAEAQHGQQALRTDMDDLTQIWTPCYEILPSRWIAHNPAEGVSVICSLESLQMALSDPTVEARMVPWENTPFAPEAGPNV